MLSSKLRFQVQQPIVLQLLFTKRQAASTCCIDGSHVLICVYLCTPFFTVLCMKVFRAVRMHSVGGLVVCLKHLVVHSRALITSLCVLHLKAFWGSKVFFLDYVAGFSFACGFS